jgi:hypothetical protein
MFALTTVLFVAFTKANNFDEGRERERRKLRRREKDNRVAESRKEDGGRRREYLPKSP